MENNGFHCFLCSGHWKPIKKIHTWWLENALLTTQFKQKNKFGNNLHDSVYQISNKAEEAGI